MIYNYFILIVKLFRQFRTMSHKICTHTKQTETSKFDISTYVGPSDRNFEFIIIGIYIFNAILHLNELLFLCFPCSHGGLNVFFAFRLYQNDIEDDITKTTTPRNVMYILKKGFSPPPYRLPSCQRRIISS